MDTGTVIGFSFGNYRFCVECDSNIQQYIKTLWKEYETDEFDETSCISIRITNGELPETDCRSGLWSYSDDNGVICAVFHTNDNPQFALNYKYGGSLFDLILIDKAKINIRLGLYYALMTAFSETCIGVHGVTMICGDKLVILSAPSGTGKTTLSNLLRQNDDDAVINGDYALLSVGDDGFIRFEPTPFCGSSGICRNYRFTLDCIVYLEQSEHNIWHNLSPGEACASLLSNCFLPVFDSHAREQIISNSLRIVENVQSARFAFAPEKEAADMFAEKIKNIFEKK